MADKTSQSFNVSIREAVPVCDTSAYASGDLIGDAALKLEFPVGHEQKERAGLIQSVSIIDLAAQAADIDVVFFDEEPDNTTFTDNAAFDPADADMEKIIGVASVTDWKSFSDNAFGQDHNIVLPFVLTGIYDALWAVPVSRGTPTFAAATDLRIRVGILPLL